MITRKQIRIMIYKNTKCIEMVQRYDGVFSPHWESDFEYFVNKMRSKFLSIFKR